MMHRFLTFIFLILLTACQDGPSDAEKPAQQTSADSEKIVASVENAKEDLPEGHEAIRKHCPDMDNATIKGILKPTSPSRPDYDFYAREFCVSHEEARRRLALQGEWYTGETGKMVQELITQIQLEERDSFAGHWIQHTPEYGLAVAFTKDAKRTLAKYTDNPIFIPVDIKGTDKKTIERNSYRIMAMMEKLDIPYHSADRDYKTGTFLVKLSVDKEDYIRDQAAKGIIDLPDWVRFTTPPQLPRPVPAPSLSPERLTAFPQYRHRREFDIQTQVGVRDIAGTLRLVKGCLAFEKDGDAKTILWQKYHAPDLTDPHRVGVMSRYNGPTIFAGEDIVISGLQPGLIKQVNGTNTKPELWALVADETDGACPGPYVMVENVTSLSEVQKLRTETDVKHLMTTFNISREEALVQVRQEDKISKELADLVLELKETRRDVIAGVFPRFPSSFSALSAGYGKYSPPAASIFVKGEVDKASLIPSHLIDYVHMQSTSKSLADADKDIAYLEEHLGNSADIQFGWFNGSISIENITDLKPLSRLKVSLGKDWPEHYKIPLEHQTMNLAYFGPTTFLDRYELQQRSEYKEILEYAESKFPKADYHRVDRAVVTLLSYGLSDLEEIKRLESLGFGPLSGRLAPNAVSRKLYDAINAEAIVTAKPVDIDTNDDREDGYRSTVTFEVKERVKGRLQAGETFKVRFQSGEDEDGHHVKVGSEHFLLPGFDYSFADRKDWFLFISNRAYNAKTRDKDSTDEPLWIISGRAIPKRDNQYMWFGQTISPAQMREQIKGMDTPENIIAYVNSLPRPPKGVCNIQPGVPEEGLGVYRKDSDVYNLNLTFKDQSLGCDHEGPQNQECRIEAGGYITWIEDGQRRHIRAEGGYADIILTNGLGARCNE